MYKALIGDHELEINQEDHKVMVDGEVLDWDVSSISDRKFHILHQHQSYNAEIISIDKLKKQITLKLNGKQMIIDLKTKLDLLLEELGMDKLATHILSDIKAPMPGLIFEISVQEGDEVNEGDTVMILEAMKMENVIKSPGAGKVKSVNVGKGDSVEKNQVLIEFEK